MVDGMVRLETSEQKRCTPVKTANKWDDIVHTIHPKDPVVNPLFTYFFCFPLPRGAIRPPPPSILESSTKLAKDHICINIYFVLRKKNKQKNPRIRGMYIE